MELSQDNQYRQVIGYIAKNYRRGQQQAAQAINTQLIETLEFISLKEHIALKYMRLFANAWPDRAIVQRTVAQLPWRTNLTLLEKLDTPELWLCCAQKALILGLSKDIPKINIENTSQKSLFQWHNTGVVWN
ncbi:hypothetical protein [Limnobacter sp.]|uniref:hypothetical protein n=1 Tax=Limnobacter sp. TaxID=2003368 RepID=UPI002733192D|nr:hypothetical protein [Limnobacter sp.]MDP3189272.1 hypothetical protein [Limnobacter sp.]